MDIGLALVLRASRSIDVFCDVDETFVWGDWKAWQAACLAEGRTIPPAEFKALPKDVLRAYLKTPNVAGKAPAR